MHWGRNLPIPKQSTAAHDATAFQTKVATILDCVTRCIRKRLVKEQITICTDRHTAVAALLVADCIEKLTALLEENQVTLMWVSRYSSIQQNETADWLARKVARTKSVGLEPFLPFLSRFKSRKKKLDRKKRTYGMESLW